MKYYNQFGKKYMKDLQNKISKQFDEKFARINHIHRGECVITDITGSKFEAHTDDKGVVTQVGGLESVKDFLFTIPNQVIEAIIEKIKAIPDTDPDVQSDDYDMGLKDMKQRIITLLMK